MKRIQKKEKGITLIALVVTIVVLLILAGVSINLVIGQNGLIKKAGDAKDATEQAVEDDRTAINTLYDEMVGFLDESNGGNGGGSGNGGLSPEDTTATTTPYLPTGFSKVVGTSLSTGLVIQDSTGNQYVWVEVPKTDTVYPNAGLAITNFTEDEYTAIENDLHTYTSTYRNGTSYTDTYYPEKANTGWFADATAYNTAKNNMLKSVYENGGFYVGRYETGISTTQSPRAASGNTTGYTPVIKANAYPYNYVTRTQAKELAESMEHGDKTSSLMFGVQWDLVLAFMHNKGGVEDSLLTSDSKTIGNYANAKFSMTSTSAKYAIYSQSSYTLGTWHDVPADYEKPDSGTENCVLLTTGANETRNSQMNICDIAGNVCEWTLEYASGALFPCATRGGNYYNGGSNVPASLRNIYFTTESNGNFGFRVSLY